MRLEASSSRSQPIFTSPSTRRNFVSTPSGPGPGLPLPVINSVSAPSPSPRTRARRSGNCRPSARGSLEHWRIHQFAKPHPAHAFVASAPRAGTSPSSTTWAAVMGNRSASTKRRGWKRASRCPPSSGASRSRPRRKLSGTWLMKRRVRRRNHPRRQASLPFLCGVRLIRCWHRHAARNPNGTSSLRPPTGSSSGWKFRHIAGRSQSRSPPASEPT